MLRMLLNCKVIPSCLSILISVYTILFPVIVLMVFPKHTHTHTQLATNDYLRCFVTTVAAQMLAPICCTTRQTMLHLQYERISGLSGNWKCQCCRPDFYWHTHTDTHTSSGKDSHARLATELAPVLPVARQAGIDTHGVASSLEKKWTLSTGNIHCRKTEQQKQKQTERRMPSQRRVAAVNSRR